MKGKTKLGSQLVKKGVAYTGCRHGPELIPGERRRTAKEIKAASNRGDFYPAFLLWMSADFLFVSLRPIIMSVVSRVMSQLFPPSETGW